MQSESFPTILAGKDIQIEEKEFEQHNLVYAFDHLNSVFQGINHNIASHRVDLSHLDEGDKKDLFTEEPKGELLISQEHCEHKCDDHKEFIGMYKTTVLSGKKKKAVKRRNRASSNADVVKNQLEKKFKHKTDVAKRLPSKSINSFKEFGL